MPVSKRYGLSCRRGSIQGSMVQEVCTLELLDVGRGERAVGIGLDGNRLTHVDKVDEDSSSQPKPVWSVST